MAARRSIWILAATLALGCGGGEDGKPFGAPATGLDASQETGTSQEAGSSEAGAGGTGGAAPACTKLGLVGCDGSVLLACDGAGKVVQAGDCASKGLLCLQPASGEKGLLGCFECAPASYAGTCEAGVGTSCGADGFLLSVPCKGDCVAGLCCEPDADGDGVRNCEGDCDDGDALVHPGQEKYFSTKSKGGTWDYNCDGVVELRDTQLGTCGCCWLPPETKVPSCGQTGKYRLCDCGSAVCADTPSHTQTCR
jgi:hypothetical protein